MAGGLHAQRVPCLVCLTTLGTLRPAERTYEGDENDEYVCALGHEFSMDWAAGEASAEQWPPSDSMKAKFSEARD